MIRLDSGCRPFVGASLKSFREDDHRSFDRRRDCYDSRSCRPAFRSTGIRAKLRARRSAFGSASRMLRRLRPERDSGGSLARGFTAGFIPFGFGRFSPIEARRLRRELDLTRWGLGDPCPDRVCLRRSRKFPVEASSRPESPISGSIKSGGSSPSGSRISVAPMPSWVLKAMTVMGFIILGVGTVLLVFAFPREVLGGAYRSRGFARDSINRSSADFVSAAALAFAPFLGCWETHVDSLRRRCVRNSSELRPGVRGSDRV